MTVVLQADPLTKTTEETLPCTLPPELEAEDVEPEEGGHEEHVHTHT